MEKLAILGGKPAIEEKPYPELFKWPIMGQEDYDAAMDVIVKNKFSGNDITEKFQAEFADWIGSKYAVCFTNGTMSLQVAMYGIGLSKGDEIICPTKTYWASIASAYCFGAVPVFANINDDLVLDPNDLERCLSPKTKAIMVVHYLGMPCDMDAIMAFAKKHNLKVIEDVSHAQGGLYKGKRLGTFGDVGAMSLMSGKSFAAGELGIAVTNDRHTYERVLAFGHYDRNNAKRIQVSEELKPYFHISLSGMKGRVNQLCAALARVQLKYYDERCAEIRRSMNYFYDLIDQIPGLKGLRIDESTGSNMAGFYYPTILYNPDEFHGLTAKTYAKAVTAEMGTTVFDINAGANFCLHTHNLFQTFDLINGGKPSRIANADRDVRVLDEKLKDAPNRNCFFAPWIKKFNKEWIEKLANVFKFVAENHESLLELDGITTTGGGHWHGFADHD